MLEAQGGRQGGEETGQQECNCGKKLGTGRGTGLRRGTVGQPRPPRGGTECEAEIWAGLGFAGRGEDGVLGAVKAQNGASWVLRKGMQR